MTTAQRRSTNPITDPYEVEEQLARELQRRKVEEEKKRREIERICANSEELKQVKMKVQTALVNKERTLQIAESQARRIQELREECEIEAALLKKRERELIEEKEQEQFKLHQRLHGREVLKKQMYEKYDATREAKEQYLREKEQVNTVVTRLIEDDRKLFETTQVKKKNAFQDMQHALVDKQQKVEKDKQREQEENAKYLEFIRLKDQQAQDIKIKKQEENAAKEQIFLKLKEEEERRRREQDLLTDLRFELYREQFEAQERDKERQEAEKRERQKWEMQQAEKEARAKKLREREEEQRMEREFKEAMMRKFSEDDKLEQLAQSKRRMKEVEHKREVEKLWQEKLSQYQAEKEKELQEHRKKLEEERYHNEVINAERDRILREHLGDIGEHIPKGLFKTPQEAAQVQQRPQQRSNYSQNFKLA